MPQAANTFLVGREEELMPQLTVDQIKDALDAKDVTGRSLLTQKLASIRQGLKHIEKKGRNEHFGYDYMRAEDVAGDIGDRLADLGVVVVREEMAIETTQTPKGAFLVTVSGYYVFVDSETGERLRTWSAGSGIDNQDKAIYKAQTGCLKYALTQALCMRVGDDPEDDSNEKSQMAAPKETLVRDDGTVVHYGPQPKPFPKPKQREGYKGKPDDPIGF
jgi:hypothetical protein